MPEYSLENLATLARLQLTDQEAQALEKDLPRILEFVEAIQNDKSPVAEPMASMNYLQTVSREDKVSPSFDRQTILSEAPSANAGFFKVPKVLE